MPYICKIRTDIPATVLQVLDLLPNSSQRNLIYDPVGQTKYIERTQNDTVAVTGIVTSAEYKGVAAWLVDGIEDAGDGGSLTAAEANTIALALVARLDTGAAMDVASVNAVIQATVAASGIAIGNSVGTLAQLLQILAGGEYVLAAGSPADSGAGNYDAVQDGAFATGQYLQTRQSGALDISLGDGHLSEFTATTYSYLDVTGAALIVLNDDGTVRTVP